MKLRLITLLNKAHSSTGQVRARMTHSEVNQESSESKGEVFKILLDENDLDDIPEEDVSNLTELPEDDFGFPRRFNLILNLQN